METLLSNHNIVVNLHKDAEKWGVKTNRWSRMSSWELRKITPNKKRCGQKPQFEWDCGFCKKSCKTLGDLRSHCEATHWAKSAYAHLKLSGDLYTCKVKNCTLKYKQNKKGLRKHYKSCHSVVDLLDAGVQAWFYRKDSASDCLMIAHWLKAKGLIEFAKKRDEKRLSKGKDLDV